MGCSTIIAIKADTLELLVHAAAEVAGALGEGTLELETDADGYSHFHDVKFDTEEEKAEALKKKNA